MMSDLQCPATLLIARPGDAAPSVRGVASDDWGVLTGKGRAQVSELAETLRARPIAAVYSSRMQGAVESGELAASELGLRSFAVDGLHEVSVRDEGHMVVKRFKEAIEEIADIHRGETVLVFTHGGAMSMVIPRLSVNVPNDFATQRFLPSCVAAEVEVDADGWRLVSWPGTAAG